MSPFPNTILSPSTANRIPLTSKWEWIIAALLKHNVNASSFFMYEDLLDTAALEGFQNDLICACSDLYNQLPPHARDAIFPKNSPQDSAPVPPANPPEDDDDDDSGMGSGMSMSMNGPSSKSDEDRRKREEEEEERERTEGGISM